MSLWISLYGSLKISTALPFCYQYLSQNPNVHEEQGSADKTSDFKCVSSIDHSLLTWRSLVSLLFTWNSFSAKISKPLGSGALKNGTIWGLRGCFTKYFDLWKKSQAHFIKTQQLLWIKIQISRCGGRYIFFHVQTKSCSPIIVYK